MEVNTSTSGDRPLIAQWGTPIFQALVSSSSHGCWWQTRAFGESPPHSCFLGPDLPSARLVPPALVPRDPESGGARKRAEAAFGLTAGMPLPAGGCALPSARPELPPGRGVCACQSLSSSQSSKRAVVVWPPRGLPLPVVGEGRQVASSPPAPGHLPLPWQAVARNRLTLPRRKLEYTLKSFCTVCTLSVRGRGSSWGSACWREREQGQTRKGYSVWDCSP